MRRILVTGALGQIGSELTVRLRELYGVSSVVASSKSAKDGHQELVDSGPFEIVDVTDRQQIADAVKKHKINTIIHLAAILSAVGEQDPHLAWDVNINGLYNILEVARAGVDTFVAGSAIFGSSDYAATITAMRAAIARRT